MSERVDHPMGHMLRSGAELKHRKNFRAGINRQPQPEHPCGAAQPGSQFVQLEMWEVEMVEESLVQDLRVLARTGQPGGNGG